MKQGYRAARTRALGAMATGAALSAGLFAYVGCSSDKPQEGTPQVDPGGTYGAEVTLSVQGRGRVLSKEFAGIDCPTSCFESFVFKDKDTRGVAGITLVAKPTEGGRFLGWKLEAAPVASRGRGPAECQPMTRQSATPGVSGSALEITLPFGDVKAAAPAGKEAACDAYTAVPVAYRVIATFEGDTPIVDAGPDAPLDGGSGELLFDTPMVGAVGRGIGVTGGRLYWQWDVGGQSAVSTGSVAGGVANNIVALGPMITQFAVDQHVVFQTNAGSLSSIAGGDTNVVSLAGASTCVAVASDTQNAYCRTAGPNGEIHAWTAATGTGPSTHVTGLPSGTDLSVDTSTFYLSDNASGAANAGTVGSIARPTDGGVAALTPIAQNQSSPTELQHNTSRVAWVNYDTNTNVGTALAASRFGGALVTAIPATLGLRTVAMDPSSTVTFFGLVTSAAPNGSAIYRASAAGGTPTVFRSQLTGVGGIAVDSTHLYWTDGNARVFRTRKF